MLLRQELSDGVEVLSVRGPVEDHEADQLLVAVQRALQLEPHRVVLDLGQVSALSPHARLALGALPQLADGTSLPSLVVRPPAGASDAAEGVRSCGNEVLADRRALPRTRIDVEHSALGPAQARAAVHEHAEALGLNGVRDDVLLLVSEMVTNAVRYATPPVRLEISAGAEDVVVAVCDGSTAQPSPRPVDKDAEGGRGMLLVDMLATEHGVRTDPPGKAVWVRLPRRGTGS